MAMGMAMVMK
jgi:hypothetical protein